MAVSASFLAFVLEQLAGLREVSSRRMFGGVGVYSRETFFAVLDNDTLFFKVDDLTRPRYVKKKMPPFRPMPEMPPMMGYFQVPPSVLEDRDAISEWAKEAVEVGERSGERKRKKDEGRRKKPKARSQKRNARS
jgi:DNA transformation protein